MITITLYSNYTTSIVFIPLLSLYHMCMRGTTHTYAATYISVTSLLGSVEFAVTLYTHPLRLGVAKLTQRYLVLGAVVTEDVSTSPATGK